MLALWSLMSNPNVLSASMRVGSCMGCCDPGAAVLQSWHSSAVCVSLCPLLRSPGTRESSPGPALLPVSAPTSKLAWSYRGRCRLCEPPSPQLSQLLAGSGWHVHAAWNGTAVFRLHFLGDWCVTWGARYMPNEEQSSPFIKKFQPVQICLQCREGRDVARNKCLL